MYKYRITNVSGLYEKPRNVYLVEVGKLLRPGDQCCAHRVADGTEGLVKARVLKIEEGAFDAPSSLFNEATTPPLSLEERKRSAAENKIANEAERKKAEAVVADEKEAAAKAEKEAAERVAKEAEEKAAALAAEKEASVASSTGTPNQEARERMRKALRLFLNDTPELNRLIRREESTDEKLDLAIDLAIDDFNITAPLLATYTDNTFPSLYLMIYGASIQVLRSAGLLQSRNELAYSSGGVSVRIFDKTQLYQSWIAQFVAEYERKKQNFKISLNINSSLASGVASEYSILNYFW